MTYFLASYRYNPTQAIVMDGTHGQEITVKAIMEKDGTVSDVMKAVFKIEGTLGMQAHEQRQIAEKYAAEARKDSISDQALRDRHATQRCRALGRGPETSRHRR